MSQFGGSAVANFAVQLQGVKPGEIGASEYDLVIVDYHSKADVDVMRARPGEDRQVISYMSVGEAEQYRSYWKSTWNNNPPGWIDEENPNWPGSYRVKFWDANWQSLIFGNQDAYLDKIIKAGFDGVFLDTIDTYAYYGGPNSKAAADMVAFVAKISQYAKAINPDFKVIAQNSEPLLKSAAYLSAIDGVSKESLFYNAGKPNAQQDIDWSLSYLKPAYEAGKAIFNIEYVTGQSAINAAFEKAADQGFLNYVGPRLLDTLSEVHETPAAVILENALPIGRDDMVTVLAGAPSVVKVLANDHDADADKLHLTTVSKPAHGTAAINPDGTVTYKSSASYSGSDRFTYTVADDRGGKDTAEVVVEVKTPIQLQQSTITVHASADHYLGAPQMRVSVDGKSVAARTVEAAHAKNQWQDFTFKANLPNGADEVSVAFTNDAYGGIAGKDRNLWVQYIEVNGVRLASTDAVYERSSGSHQLGTSALTHKGALVFDVSDILGHGSGAAVTSLGAVHDTTVGILGAAGDTNVWP
jgi:cysteinyl-tRNA synthetase